MASVSTLSHSDGGGGSGSQCWQGTVLSVGIFVGTALLTTTTGPTAVAAGIGGWKHRWWRRRLQQQREQSSSLEKQPHDRLDQGARHSAPTSVPTSSILDAYGGTAGTEGGGFGGPYAHRRLEDRLSFHEHDDDGNQSSRRTQQSRLFSSAADTTTNNDNNEDPAGGDDFYPMNANWSHFDLTELWRRHKDGDQETNSALPVMQRQASLEGDRDYHPRPPSDHNPDDRAAPVLSNAANTKAAQFVWTTAAVHQKHPKKQKETDGAPAGSSATKAPTAPPSNASVSSVAHAAVETIVPIHHPESSDRTPVSKSPLNRAESLDDRTVWGDRVASLHDPYFPLPTSQLPFHQSSTATTTTTTTNTTSYTTDSDAFQGDITIVAGSSPFRSLAPRRCRSASVTADSTEPPPTAATSTTKASGYDRDLAAAVRRQNAKARAAYNARIMPHAVILVRHGQSLGNTNEELYATVPDNAMPLTELGWEQARAAGRTLKKLLNDKNHNPHFVVSPYVRTVETFHGMASAWCDPADFKHITDRDARLAAWYSRLLALGLTWHEDPRIREQDFGNYQNASIIRQAKRDRHRFGAFYYRFPHGESASDVFDRISTFLDSLWRSFDVHRSRVYVLVTHGIAIRVLLSRYFRYTIAQFGMLANPRNGEMVVLRHDGHGRLRLAGRYELELEEPGRPGDADVGGDDEDDPGGDENTGSGAGGDPKHPKEGKTRVVGVSFHERLRVLPPEYIRKVPIRISYDDEDND